ncbi:MAG: WD40 repeat protein [Phormidium sp. OSCR]|nr:MAG: WD40 repeat protein [Phormidium sp. OSCR]
MDIAAKNEKSLRQLAQAIALSRGQFKLILVRCNYQSLGDRWSKRLESETQRQHQFSLLTASLPMETQNLTQVIETAMEGGTAEGIQLRGMTQLADLRGFLAKANQMRDQLRHKFSFPIVLWLDENGLREMLEVANDLESWTTSKRFLPSKEDIQGNLQLNVQQFLTRLEQGGDRQWLGRDRLLGENQQREIEQACQQLAQLGEPLCANLAADLALIQGRQALEAGESDQATAHFRQSQTHWQTLLNPLPEGDRPTEAQLPETDNSRTPQLRLAIIGVHQALNQVLALEHHDENNLDLAAIQEQLHRSHEQFIEAGATQFAQKLQESSLMQLIQALREAEAAEAKGDIHGAIAPLANISQQRVFALPYLGLRGLQQLQQLYFNSADYRNAFTIAQQQHQLERYCGKRAFIGANRLEEMPQQQPTSSWRSPEIEQSGRAEDVKQLLNRLHERQNKLLVVHGESGVGKSSLVNAGLLPMLREQVFAGGRGGVPIVLRVYENWPEQLTQVIEEEAKKHLCMLDNSGDMVSPLTVSQATLVELEKRHHQVILVFDQFEEFFFANPNPKDHRQFFDFLGTLCSNILELGALKVVLSLRTDYIHRLLVCNRISTMACISQNVLDKTILYELNNLSPQQSSQVIAKLAPHITDDLRSRLVQDLQQESEDIRPIELQVVGYQLESEGIVSLGDYNALGEHPKQALVERYLDVVVESCGPQNKDLADAVLYLLTDERGTRPLRTRRDLLRDLKLFETNYGQQSLRSALNLVLDIIAGSRLVFLIPGQQERYQLVHDYLAEFIHKSRGGGLLAKLEEEQEKRVAAEKTLEELEDDQKKVQKRTQSVGILGGLLLAVFAGGLFGVSREFTVQRTQYNEDKQYFEDERLLADLERESRLSLRQFEAGRELESLIKGTEISVKFIDFLERISSSRPTAMQPVYNLRKILGNIREINIIEGHSSWIYGVDFSPDGRLVASASNDETIRVWDVQTGEEIHPNKFVGHRGPVKDVQFSPDGTRLLSASDDKTIRIWNLETGEQEKVFGGHDGRVNSARFNFDGTQIVSASNDGSIIVWDALNGIIISRLYGHQDVVKFADFSPDGTKIASGSDDATVRLWNLETRSEINSSRFENHSSSVLMVAFHPRENKIASASSDGTIQIWDISSREIEKTLTTTGYVHTVMFNSDGTRLLSGGSDAKVKLWNIKNGEEIETLQGHRSTVYRAAFSQDGTKVVSVSNDATIRIWSVESRYVTQQFEGHEGTIYSADINPDSTRLVSAPHDGIIRVWDLETGDVLFYLEGHQQPVHRSLFSPDGSKIVSAGRDGRVILWDAETGELIRSFVKN